MNWRLRELLAPWCDAPDIPVAGLTQDSRQVAPGDLFIAVRGSASDGHDHAPEAAARGASAVLAERPLDGLAVPLVVLPDLARRRSALASRFFGEPSRALRCVGVTGTNGKTSVAAFIAQLASRLGVAAGYLGTLGWGMAPPFADAGLTTADAIETQRRLAGLRDQGARWAVLEVSSHALDQYRVEAVHFRTAVFTNLSRDHLDYHGSMAAYAQAKRRLFSFPDLEVAVINADDPEGQWLADHLGAGIRPVRYGAAAPEVRWDALEFLAAGIHGRWHTCWGDAPLELPLYGEFSVANAAAALGVLCAAGFALQDVAAAWSGIRAVDGRMEFLRIPGQPTVVVDFAHTPDGLRAALAALRRHCGGRLFCVVGCGGDRDRGKRPQMAAAAEQGADVVCLTSDNPRSEDPLAILADMRAGLQWPAQQIADRREAIRWAIASAAAEDVVLVAGKGHERYQEINGVRHPFSDRAVALDLLEANL